MPKLSLQPDHIVDIFVPLDDLLPQVPKPKGGRPNQLRDSELVTILIWNCLTSTRQQTLKDLHSWVLMYHRGEFPKTPDYGAFVAHVHRILPTMVWLLEQLLVPAAVQLADSTKLPVCRNHRAKRHKVARGLAGWGKNWQGYWYGFKLHAAIDVTSRLSGIAFTPADVYDGHVMPQLVNQTKVVVGDSHYGDKIARAKMWRLFGIIVVAPPHYKQRKQVMARWQEVLLHLRSKVECTFDYLKEHLHLVSSFPRSVKGYLVHYVRILLGYQVLACGGF
jgi:Transposase DDE domain